MQQQYTGTAEDALIAFLQDENKSAYEKTHKATWTLGQIRSQKALPILKELYQNDPKGETCYGKHDNMPCQYENTQSNRTYRERHLHASRIKQIKAHASNRIFSVKMIFVY